MIRRNLGAAATPAITFHVVNSTSPEGKPRRCPAYSNSQIYVASPGRTPRGPVRLPRSQRQCRADEALRQHGARPPDQERHQLQRLLPAARPVAGGWDVPDNLAGARLWVGLGSPLYFQVNTDAAGHIGYTTPNLSNPTDPNIDIYWDHTEFATVNNGINANTTQVDQFGSPS